MAGSGRSGFRKISKEKNAVQAEPVVSEERQIAPGNKRRRISSKEVDDPSDQLLSETKRENAENQVKTYYPKIPFNRDEFEKRFVPSRTNDRRRSTSPKKATLALSSMNSAQMTTMLVEAICDEESFGLEAFFSDPRYASRNSTLSNLQSVLQKVKTDTRQSLEDTPTTELVADRSSNLKQIEALQETKELLENQLLTLKHISESTSFLEERGVMGPNALHNMVGAHESTSSAEISRAYQSQLFHFETLVDSVLDSLSGMAQGVSRAATSQEQLYTTHQKERAAVHVIAGLPAPPSSSSVSVPKDPKKLIKAFAS